jgi:hypothetical protein
VGCQHQHLRSRLVPVRNKTKLKINHSQSYLQSSDQKRMTHAARRSDDDAPQTLPVLQVFDGTVGLRSDLTTQHIHLPIYIEGKARCRQLINLFGGRYSLHLSRGL